MAVSRLVFVFIATRLLINPTHVCGGSCVVTVSVTWRCPAQAPAGVSLSQLCGSLWWPSLGSPEAVNVWCPSPPP